MSKLKRSDNRILGGVCAGIAESLNTDPTIIRLLWAISIFLFGTGLFVYLLCWIIIPSK